MFSKRAFVKYCCLFLSFLLITFTFCACSKQPNDTYTTIPYYDNLSVHFIDVSNGDCTFINLPDGKTALIDCGNKNPTNLKKIKMALDVYSVRKIDYFILTHPHENHVGNALDLLKSYNVGTLYTPTLPNNSLFPQFNQALEYAKQKNVNVKTSFVGTQLGDGSFNFIFLYPEHIHHPDGAYSNVIKIPQPTETDIDNLSAVLYLEYNGVRFLFTGDITQSAEHKLIDYYLGGYYLGYCVTLEKIDFLKVSSHGADSANSQRFLNLLSAKNAFISVNKNRPQISDNSLSLLKFYNENCNIFRSDYHGWTSVHVKGENSFTYTTLKSRSI